MKECPIAYWPKCIDPIQFPDYQNTTYIGMVSATGPSITYYIFKYARDNDVVVTWYSPNTFSYKAQLYDIAQMRASTTEDAFWLKVLAMLPEEAKEPEKCICGGLSMGYKTNIGHALHCKYGIEG